MRDTPGSRIETVYADRAHDGGVRFHPLLSLCVEGR